MLIIQGIASQGVGSVGLAFHALTPDDTTYEMLGVKTGTGGLTTTHTATIYSQDIDGVYRAFAANAPVWNEGRRVYNYAADLSAYSTSNATAVPGTTDPIGGTGAYRVTATADAARFYLTSAGSEASRTGLSIQSIWLRLQSGTGTVKFWVTPTAIDLPVTLTN